MVLLMIPLQWQKVCIMSLINSDPLSDCRWHTFSPDCLSSMVKMSQIAILVSSLVCRSLPTGYLQLTSITTKVYRKPSQVRTDIGLVMSMTKSSILA